jgi:hypothetical protein
MKFTERTLSEVSFLFKFLFFSFRELASLCSATSFLQKHREPKELAVMCLKMLMAFSVAFKPKQAFYKEEFSDTLSVPKTLFLLYYADRIFAQDPFLQGVRKQIFAIIFLQKVIFL